MHMNARNENVNAERTSGTHHSTYHVTSSMGGEVFAQKIMSPWTINTYNLNKFIPCWSVMGILHANAALITVNLLGHCFDQSKEDIILFVFSLNSTFCKVNKD